MENAKTYILRIQKASNLQLLLKMADYLGLTFAEYYFKLQGVSLYKLILMYAIAPLVSLPIVTFCNNWDVQRFMRYGLLSYIGMSLSLVFYNQYSYLLFAIFTGLGLGFFWVSFNYVFFLRSNVDSNAKDSSIYFIIGPLVGIILPPLGALLIHDLSYRAVFFIGLLLFMLPLAYVKNESFSFKLHEDFAQARRAFKGLRMLTALNYALHYFQSNFLALYALFFLKTQYEVSGMFSYLAILSIFASFALAHLSDKSKRRATILYPIMSVMAVLILVIPGLKSLSALVVIGGLYAILDNLSLPIRFAVPMDLSKPGIGFWRAAEFYGNIGRTIVFTIASLLLFFGNKWLAFGMFAVMTFAFPFIITHKTKALENLKDIKT